MSRSVKPPLIDRLDTCRTRDRLCCCPVCLWPFTINSQLANPSVVLLFITAVLCHIEWYWSKAVRWTNTTVRLNWTKSSLFLLFWGSFCTDVVSSLGFQNKFCDREQFKTFRLEYCETVAVWRHQFTYTVFTKSAIWMVIKNPHLMLLIPYTFLRSAHQPTYSLNKTHFMTSIKHQFGTVVPSSGSFPEQRNTSAAR
jgi:hypothetical protein